MQPTRAGQHGPATQMGQQQQAGGNQPDQEHGQEHGQGQYPQQQQGQPVGVVNWWAIALMVAQMVVSWLQSQSQAHAQSIPPVGPSSGKR